MLDKGQTQRYSKGELELLRGTFGGDDTLLHQMRDVLLQNNETIPRLSSEILTVVKKVIFAWPDTEVPLEIMGDMYFPLLPELSKSHPEISYMHIRAKDVQIAYLEQQFNALSGEKTNGVEKIVLADLKKEICKVEGIEKVKNKEERVLDMLAYCNILAYVHTIMGELKTRANQKEESEEEKAKREQMNSSK